MINRNFHRATRAAREEATQEVISVMQDGGYFNGHEDIFDKLIIICDKYMSCTNETPYTHRWLELREAMRQAAYVPQSKIIINWSDIPDNAYYLDHFRQERTEEIIKTEIGI